MPRLDEIEVETGGVHCLDCRFWLGSLIGGYYCKDGHTNSRNDCPCFKEREDDH